jgi:hypothetical protein
MVTTIFDSSAGIFKQSMGTMNRVGIGLSYRHARLHSLAELVPWNRFLVKPMDELILRENR